MAMSTYTEIALKVEQWLNREGFTELTDQIEDLILMGQRRIFRQLRVNDMLVVDSAFVIDSTTETVPADYKAAYTFSLSLPGGQADMKSSPIRNVRKSGTSGIPKYFAKVGANFYFGPAPDGTYTAELIYYAEPTLISLTDASNWLSLSAPELIMYGALVEASLFLKDDARVQFWEAKFQNVFRALEQESEEESRDAGGLSVVSEGITSGNMNFVP
jgi:hypothetical protein